MKVSKATYNKKGISMALVCQCSVKIMSLLHIYMQGYKERRQEYLLTASEDLLLVSFAR